MYQYEKDTYLIDAKVPRFGSGEAKGIINESVRGKDLYLMVDVCNYSLTYSLTGNVNHMSPDDHFQNLKRIIAAVGGKGRRINVIMPFLYESRQHKRGSRESLDCALALQELVRMGVDNIITFDAHDPRVQNAIPLNGFETIRPTYQFIKGLLRTFKDLQIDSEHMMAISPDEGAQYSYLRDKNGTADFSQWPDHNVWDEAERKDLTNPKTEAYQNVEFFYFVQFILNKQMQEAHEHAKAKGVILKGDIPIGVHRHSCDVWVEPKYFNLNGQAGAPPDDFSVNGQNWGFPTYNWDEMLKDGCLWWTRRFQNMSKFFDAYRIDHVLGFFRIWEIPVHSVHGLLGQFAPALAMTRGEIQSYGLNFQEDRFTRPFITDWVLDRMFYERADEVKEKYLDRLDDERYQMKPEVDTQRKVEALFQDVTDEKEIWLRDGLYALISDVLFVRDRKDPELFHPRISAQLDFIYESLYDNDKAAFNRLYNDYFYRRNNQFWYGEAMKKLPKLVQATRMLVCAEDLGMVPDCVPWVMNELKILSLELQSMPKDPTVKFGHLSRNPYRSVCTISSHDMPTLRMWWDENISRTQEYYNTMLYREGPAPHPLPGWLARDIIARHLASPSMLCILSVQDWLAIDEKLRLPDAEAERINIPANPKHYWRYRMHLSLEELAANKEFMANITELVAQGGRN